MILIIFTFEIDMTCYFLSSSLKLYYSISFPFSPQMSLIHNLSILILLTLYAKCITSIRLHIGHKKKKEKSTRCCLYYIHVNEVNPMTFSRVVVCMALR